MVRVQLELCLGIIAKLHERHLYQIKELDSERDICRKKSISQKISLKCRATNLHAARVDDVEGSNHVEDKLDHLTEAVITDTPRAVNEEDQISLSTFANCERCSTMSVLFLV